MGDATVITSSWRMVELGRVVLFTAGKHEGRLAAIVEIVDHKRVRPQALHPRISHGSPKHRYTLRASATLSTRLHVHINPSTDDTPPDPRR